MAPIPSDWLYQRQATPNRMDFFSDNLSLAYQNTATKSNLLSRTVHFYPFIIRLLRFLKYIAKKSRRKKVHRNKNTIDKKKKW